MVLCSFLFKQHGFYHARIFRKAFSESSRWILTIITLVSALTKVSVTVYAGAVVFETLMGIESGLAHYLLYLSLVATPS